MLQEIIALAVIAFFVGRLAWQARRGQIPGAQFIFWLGFWLAGAVVVFYLRALDALASRLGFSSSGIEILLYVAVVAIFSYVFRLRLKIAALERDLTTVIRNQALASARRHPRSPAAAATDSLE